MHVLWYMTIYWLSMKWLIKQSGSVARRLLPNNRSLDSFCSNPSSLCHFEYEKITKSNTTSAEQKKMNEEYRLRWYSSQKRVNDDVATHENYFQIGGSHFHDMQILTNHFGPMLPWTQIDNESGDWGEHSNTAKLKYIQYYETIDLRVLRGIRWRRSNFELSIGRSQNLLDLVTVTT